MKHLNFKESDRILVLAPHPDDESIGCGWLLLKHPKQCEVVILTDGRHGWLSWERIEDVITKRRTELEQALKYAQIKKFSFLDIEDGTLSDNYDKFAHLDISKYDAIFSPSPNETHPDHACVYDFLKRLNTQWKVFWYEVRSTLTSPSHYLDISNIVQQKQQLINFHASQTAQLDYASRILALNHFRGLLKYPAIEYAEAYQKLQ